MRSDAKHTDLTRAVIGACIEVHRHLGPGLLESAYEMAVAHELGLRRLEAERQVPIPVTYKGVVLPIAYRADFIVEDLIVLELRSVAALLPVHEAQVITYLRLRRLYVGLLVNFHVPVLRCGGLKRLIWNGQ